MNLSFLHSFSTGTFFPKKFLSSYHTSHLHRQRFFFIFCFFIFLFIFLYFFTKPAVIILNVDNQTILQNQLLPSLTVSVSIKGKTTKVLEKGYTIQNLVDDLEAEKNIVIQVPSDITKEGTYILTAQEEGDLADKLSNQWAKKVKIVNNTGVLTVKNKYGQWDGLIFKNWEGQAITNQFIVYEGNTFYINSESKAALSWQTIHNELYYFNGDGVMQTGWVEQNGKKYYLQDDGIAIKGWNEINGHQYYFNQNGAMAVGTVQMGHIEYQFAEDGVYLFSKVLGIDVTKPMVALTFDDGPGPYTQHLLDILQQYNVRATFFMLGKQVHKYPNVVQQMYAQGNELGNHTVNHKKLTDLTSEEIQQQIQGTNDELKNVVGVSSTVFRPPYGSINEDVKKLSPTPDILWSIDTLDWKTKNEEAILAEVIGKVQDGDIILMHDIHETTVQTVEKMIPQLLEQGFQVVTVSEMAAAKQMLLVPGQVVRSFK